MNGFEVIYISGPEVVDSPFFCSATENDYHVH